MPSIIRSMLYAPGNQPRKMEKVFSFGADAVCLDLEDAVPNTEKQAARTLVAEALKISRDVPLYVRINALDTSHCFSDVEAVVTQGLAGLVVPMIESASALLTIDWLVRQFETRRSLPVGSTDIIPVIETASGIVHLEDVCRSGSRVRQISFGAWDYTLDTGITYTPEEDSIADARARVVLYSRSAGLQPPMDTSYPVLGDIEGLKRSSLKARSMGFQGKACIHPEQVGPINDAFSVNADEMKQALAIVMEFEKAEAAGSASIRVDGRFVDYPMYKKAKALVDSQR